MSRAWRAEEQPPLAPGKYLTCWGCEQRVYDQDELTDGGCPECRCEAFTLRDFQAGSDDVASRWPEGVGVPFVALPVLLLEHGEALGLESDDLLVLLALESHRFRADAPVWPSLKTLAALTRLSASSVQRSERRMREKGLIDVERERRTAPNRYTRRGLDDGLRQIVETSHRPLATGRADLSRPVTLTAETEEVEAEEVEADTALRAARAGRASARAAVVEYWSRPPASDEPSPPCEDWSRPPASDEPSPPREGDARGHHRDCGGTLVVEEVELLAATKSARSALRVVTVCDRCGTRLAALA